MTDNSIETICVCVFLVSLLLIGLGNKWIETTGTSACDHHEDEYEEPDEEEMFQIGYQTAAGHLLQGHHPENLQEDLDHAWSSDYDRGVTAALNARKEKVKS
jgi:hypothetical protein